MPETPVANWESIIHKNVRSADGEDSGNVIAVEGDTILVDSEGDRGHFIIPKSLVADFNGAEVILNKPRAELYQYKKR